MIMTMRQVPMKMAAMIWFRAMDVALSSRHVWGPRPPTSRRSRPRSRSARSINTSFISTSRKSWRGDLTRVRLLPVPRRRRSSKWTSCKRSNLLSTILKICSQVRSTLTPSAMQCWYQTVLLRLFRSTWARLSQFLIRCRVSGLSWGSISTQQALLTCSTRQWRTHKIFGSKNWPWKPNHQIQITDFL